MCSYTDILNFLNTYDLDDEFIEVFKHFLKERIVKKELQKTLYYKKLQEERDAERCPKCGNKDNCNCF
tara:strand:+ start:437 stop:640 length:204 start_codon:yes stop_codon:yes gene_type:complete